MLIELRLWRSFVVLADELNFRRAADRLGLSQPALTKQIKELEARLGVTLFNREPRGVERTAAADAHLDGARALIADAEALERAFRATDEAASEEVTVGALSYISQRLLPRALAGAQRSHPALAARVVEMTPLDTVAATAEGRIDLGIALEPVTEPTLVARPLVTGEWMVVTAQDQALEAEPGLPDLDGRPLILFDRRNNPDLYDRVTARLAEACPRARVAYHVQDPSAAIEMAAHGLGGFIAASYVLPPLSDAVAARPIPDLDEPISLSLVWRRDRMRPALRALVDGFLEARSNQER